MLPPQAPSGPPSGGGAPAATEQPRDVTERVFSLIEWTAATDVRDAERLCLAGAPVECLRLADSESSRTASERQLRKSRAHRERAYSMLVLQCHRRKPDACAMIARMHALQLGLPKDPAGQSALLRRTQRLCQHHHPAKVCAAFGP